MQDDGQLLSYPANSHFELSGLPGIDILLDSSSGRSAGGGGSGGGSDDGSGSLLRDALRVYGAGVVRAAADGGRARVRARAGRGGAPVGAHGHVAVGHGEAKGALWLVRARPQRALRRHAHDISQLAAGKTQGCKLLAGPQLKICVLACARHPRHTGGRRPHTASHSV
eukprot:6176248-Pleurochrysis_carterae.AAC.2